MSNSKVKIKREGQPCRYCGLPVIKRVPQRDTSKIQKNVKKGKTYYYEYYFYCKPCRVFYMVEAVRRYYADLPDVKLTKPQVDAAKDSKQRLQRTQKREIQKASTPIKSKAEIATLRKLPYVEYLQTAHWQSTKLGALKRGGHKCQLCSKTDSLNVHHNTYKHLGDERPEDLVVLCRGCHAKFHNKPM